MVRVILDASVLIALYDPKDAHHAWALGFMNETLDSDLAITALTYAEILVHPMRAGLADRFENGIKGLGIEVLPLDATDARPLADLRASSGLRMPDAVVLQSAVSQQAALATCDVKLATVAFELGHQVHRP